MVAVDDGLWTKGVVLELQEGGMREVWISAPVLQEVAPSSLLLISGPQELLSLQLLQTILVHFTREVSDV